jgi:hypothetical protein
MGDCFDEPVIQYGAEHKYESNLKQANVQS